MYWQKFHIWRIYVNLWDEKSERETQVNVKSDLFKRLQYKESCKQIFNETYSLGLKPSRDQIRFCFVLEEKLFRSIKVSKMIFYKKMYGSRTSEYKKNICVYTIFENSITKTKNYSIFQLVIFKYSVFKSFGAIIFKWLFKP